jgi:CRISPR-associated protein Cas1
MEVHINTYGAALRVRGEVFLVRTTALDGSGDATNEYAPQQVSAFLVYTNAASLSADAVELAAKHGIPIVFMNGMGQSLGRIHYDLSPSDIEVQLGQLYLVGKPQSIELVQHWLCQKLKRKLQLLKQLERWRKNEKIALLTAAQAQLQQYLQRLQSLSVNYSAECLATIRGIEGNASKQYFEAISKLLPAEYRFDSRSRRPAKDIFNAFLNFGYGVLYNLVENTLLRHGIHPSIGFMHSMKRYQKAMLFDFIEPYRPWVDAVIVKICAQKLVTTKHLRPHKNGLWLSKDGITLFLENFHEQFNKDLLLLSGKPISYLRLLQQEAESLAHKLRKTWKAQAPFHYDLSYN